MMLLDTDVLIDIALDRRPHSDPAAALLDRIESTGETVFVAWHSVSNFYYLVSPSHGRRRARDFIVELTRFVQVAPADAEAIRYAASLPSRKPAAGPRRLRSSRQAPAWPLWVRIASNT